MRLAHVRSTVLLWMCSLRELHERHVCLLCPFYPEDCCDERGDAPSLLPKNHIGTFHLAGIHNAPIQHKWVISCFSFLEMFSGGSPDPNECGCWSPDLYNPSSCTSKCSLRPTRIKGHFLFHVWIDSWTDVKNKEPHQGFFLKMAVDRNSSATAWRFFFYYFRSSGTNGNYSKWQQRR